MGIKKLFTFIEHNNLYNIYPYLDNLINDLGINKNELIIGVDANLFCYKYMHSCNTMLNGFLNQIIKFLSNNIIPLYIFDGGTIQEKEETNLYRYHKKIINKYKLDHIDDNEHNFNIKKKLEKNSIKINNTDINLLLELLELFNIPYIFSHGEGEFLAVMLNNYNIIDMFLTDDTDPIPSGILKIIKFYNNNVYYLDNKETANKLGMTFDMLCDFCILLGSDYASFNLNMKPAEIYNLIIKHKTIENIIKAKVFTNSINNELESKIDKIRLIYNSLPNNERLLLLNINIENLYATKDFDTNIKYNFLINHNDINYYSNTLIEFWNDLTNILNIELELLDKNDSTLFKNKINNYIKNKKLNIPNIVNFINKNIDVDEFELTNIIKIINIINT